MSYFIFIVLLTHPKLAVLALPLSTPRDTLYTYLLEKEMMINSENKNSLKGQHNLAQGFDVSVRLSLRLSLSRTANGVAPWVGKRKGKSSAR